MNKLVGVLLYFALAVESHAEVKLAVIGDSFATGAWTEPGVTLNPDDMSVLLNNEDNKNSDLRLSLPDPVEFQSAPFWVLKNALAAFTQVYLDRPDHSWILPYSKQNELSPTEVKIMARDGASVSDALLQVKSLLKHTNGHAPQKTIFFFSLMDVCAPNINMLTTADFYQRHWTDALQYFLGHAKFPENSTIEIWAPLNVTQVMNADVLDRPTPYGDQQKTCREIANQNFENMPSGSPRAALFMMYPGVYCSALVDSAGKDAKSVNQSNLTAISNRLREYRQKLAEIVKDLSKKQKQTVLVYRDDIADFKLTPERLGPDCLHLNAQGHLDLAASVVAP